MKLPNRHHAAVSIEKLRDYCLDPNHPIGKHKARVFESVLGLTAAHAGVLRDQILAAARTAEVVPGVVDQFGERYTLRMIARGPKAFGNVVTAWIIRAGESIPRLVTCYVESV